MKKYISKEKKEIWIGEQSNIPIQRIDSNIEINPRVLSKEDIADKIGYYQFEQEELKEGEYYTAEIVFDIKTKTCKPKKAIKSEKEIEKENNKEEVVVNEISDELLRELTIKMIRDFGYI